MKETRGSANPEKVNGALLRLLSEGREPEAPS
jgi:Asp-tRNA(Asn)/Glu-tRNA(Gln) amidotransferase B subunit